MKMVFLVTAITGNTAVLTPQVDPDADAPPMRHGEADVNAGRQITVAINPEDMDFWNDARGKRVEAEFTVSSSQRRSTAGSRAASVPPGTQRDPNAPRGPAGADRFAGAQPGVSAPGASTPGSIAPAGAPAGTPASGGPATTAPGGAGSLTTPGT